MRILHLITGLNQGGAERQLAALVTAGALNSAVFSLMSPGVMATPIREARVPLFSGNSHGTFSLTWLHRLRAVLAMYKPNLVMGWMYHGNLAASITRLMGYRGPVLWNVRHSVQSLHQEKVSTRWAIRAGARFSHVPATIVYNSATAAEEHEALGYDSTKKIVIPNGFDTGKFRPDIDARQKQRRLLGVAEDTWLLGVVGRSHPMKDHDGWLEAFARLERTRSDVQTLIMGRDVPETLWPKVRDLGLENRVHLMEGVSDPEHVYPAFDLLVLPSAWGEGFSNVMGEAMACGVPAVVTDVGDSGAVVGSMLGRVVPPKSPEALVDAINDLLAGGKEYIARLGQTARSRICEAYELETAINRYHQLYKEAFEAQER